MVKFVTELERARDTADVNIAAGMARQRFERTKSVMLIASLVAIVALTAGYIRLDNRLDHGRNDRAQIISILEEMHQNTSAGSVRAKVDLAS